MKGIAILLFVVYAAVARAQNTVLVEECPKDQETDWTIEKLLRHEDCNKFYKCTFGKPVEYTCPADLWFNLETQRCDWRHNVDCSDRNVPGEDSTTTAETTTTSTTPEPTTTTTTPEPTTTTTTPEPTTTTTTPEPTTTTTTPEPTTTTTTPEPTTTTTTPEPTTTTTTPEPTTTTTTPEPTTTTTTPEPTTTTTTPEPTTTTTTPEPTTTTTTPEPTTTTTTPEPTTTTTTPEPTTTTTTPEPTTTTTATTTTAAPPGWLPNGCPTNPHIHWLLPHETDCNLFYYCVWGQLVLRECPSSLHFNRVIQVCDWPWDAGCPQSFNKHLESRGSMRYN